jgi:hypothetical protein
MKFRFFRRRKSDNETKNSGAKSPEFSSLLMDYLNREDYDDFWDTLSEEEKESIIKGVEKLEKKNKSKK